MENISSKATRLVSSMANTRSGVPALNWQTVLRLLRRNLRDSGERESTKKCLPKKERRDSCGRSGQLQGGALGVSKHERGEVCHVAWSPLTLPAELTYLFRDRLNYLRPPMELRNKNCRRPVGSPEARLTALAFPYKRSDHSGGHHLFLRTAATSRKRFKSNNGLPYRKLGVVTSPFLSGLECSWSGKNGRSR